MKEKIIKETTENLSNGTITKDEANAILLNLFDIRKRCRSIAVAGGYKHCNICSGEGCRDFY